jgi:limonene-1,2-epoxide hydrolase
MTPAEIVNAFIAAIEAKDVGTAATFAADDISYENVPIDPIVGSDAMSKSLERILSGASEVEWRIVSQFECGSTVINERIDRFCNNGQWMELPVAGFFELNDAGKITLWRDYFDMNTYVSRLATVQGK